MRTPAPLPTASLPPAEPTVTAQPTQAIAAAPATAAPEAGPPKRPNLPVCGAGIVLPILFAVTLGVTRQGGWI